MSARVELRIRFSSGGEEEIKGTVDDADAQTLLDDLMRYSDSFLSDRKEPGPTLDSFSRLPDVDAEGP